MPSQLPAVCSPHQKGCYIPLHALSAADSATAVWRKPGMQEVSMYSYIVIVMILLFGSGISHRGEFCHKILVYLSLFLFCSSCHGCPSMLENTFSASLKLPQNSLSLWTRNCWTVSV